MNIQEALKQQGIEVTQNMPTTLMITLLSNIPTFKAMFPGPFAMIDQLQAYLDSLNQAKDALVAAKNKVDMMQANLEKAKDMYDMILNTPTAYVGNGVGTVAIVPTATVAYYTAIETAQKLLDQAEKALDKAQQKVDTLDAKVENYKEKIVNKFISTKV